MDIINKWCYDKHKNEIVFYFDNQNELHEIGTLKNFTQKMYDELPKTDIECLEHLLRLYAEQNAKNSNVPIKIFFNDGEYIFAVKNGTSVTFIDDLGADIRHITVSNEMFNAIVKDFSNFDKFEVMDKLLGTSDYDFGSNYKTIMNTYCEDIVFSNGLEAVQNEIQEINQDLNSMNEKDFCREYGIYKIGGLYFKE